MKKEMNKTIQRLMILATTAAFVSGCSMMSKSGNVADATINGPGGSSVTESSSTTPTISSSVGNSDSIPSRISNALMLPTGTTSLVNQTAGNFATALNQQLSNLSSTSNPITATGSGAASLLAYAACNDVKPASYNVTTGSSAASQNAALVAAGLTIVNQCTAGLAAAGTTLNTQTAAIFSTLLASNATASPAATTAQDFVSVCTAAVSFCVGMLGF